MSHNPKVITVAQQKGGAGKTTVAVHLGVALQQRGFRVSLVDTDPQGSLKKWFSLRESFFGEGYTGVRFSAISGWRIHNEIVRLRQESDVVIIDSPPHVETDARTTIRAADLVLIPIQPSPLDQWATQATLDIVQKERIPYRLVFNRVVGQAKLSKEISAQMSNVLPVSLGSRVVFASALLEGKTATETMPGSVAAWEVKEMVQEVISLLIPQSNQQTAA